MPDTDTETKSGARHSTGDMQHLQSAHDHLTALGAACADDATPPAKDTAKKDVSLDDRLSRIQSAVYDAMQAANDDRYDYDAYVVSVFQEGYAIVNDPDGGGYFKVPYTEGTDGIVTVPPRADWQRTEQSWKAEPSYAVKSLGEDRVGAYAVLFGTPNTPDISSERDYFTKATDFWLDEWDRRPMIYHHAMDAATADYPVVGAWTKATKDDIGVWLEGELKKAHEYRDAVKELIAQGVLALSSDSAPHLVTRKKSTKGTHEVTRWPLLAASLTPTPAEPRLLPVQTIKAAYKSIGVTLPASIDDPADTQRAWALRLTLELLSL